MRFSLLIFVGAVLCLNCCQEKPFTDECTILATKFGAEECTIGPDVVVIGNDTINILKVQLVNVTGAERLAPWRINTAVAFAFYQLSDSTMLSGYDAISGEITDEKGIPLANYSNSESTAYIIETFRRMDSLRIRMESIMKNQKGISGWISARDQIDTAISSQNLHKLDSIILADNSDAGVVFNSLVAGFRYVNLPGYNYPCAQIDIAEQRPSKWNIYRFTIDEYSGKIIGISYNPKE